MKCSGDDTKGGRPKCPYSVSIDQSFLSQTRNSSNRHSIVVEFRPQAFVAKVYTLKFMKVVIKRFNKKACIFRVSSRLMTIR